MIAETLYKQLVFPFIFVGLFFPFFFFLSFLFVLFVAHPAFFINTTKIIACSFVCVIHLCDRAFVINLCTCAGTKLATSNKHITERDVAQR